MTILFFILILIASVILGFIVLIQDPKGGGLAGNIGSFNSQFMGVKQTNDALVKGTWIFAGVIGVLCLLSVVFFRGSASGNVDTSILKGINTSAPASQQAAPAQQPSVPAPAK